MHALTLLLACSLASAGPDQAPRPPQAPPLRPEPEPPVSDGLHHWVVFPDGDTSQIALMRGNVQVGVWHFEGRYYRPYDRARDRWGEQCPPPIRPPERPTHHHPIATKVIPTARFASVHTLPAHCSPRG